MWMIEYIHIVQKEFRHIKDYEIMNTQETCNISTMSDVWFYVELHAANIYWPGQ